MEPEGRVTRRSDCRIRKEAMDSQRKPDLKGVCVRRLAKVGINKGFREPEFALALSSARDPAPISVNKVLYLQVFQSPGIGIPLKARKRDLRIANSETSRGPSPRRHPTGLGCA